MNDAAGASRPVQPPPGEPTPPSGVLRWLLGLPVYLYRARLGFLLGHRFLVLVHEGRRSGHRHATPLEVVRYDRSRREATVIAAWGRRTAWLHNVEAGLVREVWIARARYVPAVRRLEVDEAVEVLERYERRSGLPRSLVWSVLGRAPRLALRRNASGPPPRGRAAPHARVRAATSVNRPDAVEPPFPVQRRPVRALDTVPAPDRAPAVAQPVRSPPR